MQNVSEIILLWQNIEYVAESCGLNVQLSAPPTVGVFEDKRLICPFDTLEEAYAFLIGWRKCMDREVKEIEMRTNEILISGTEIRTRDQIVITLEELLDSEHTCEFREHYQDGSIKDMQLHIGIQMSKRITIPLKGIK